jgi:hypothetical protein
MGAPPELRHRAQSRFYLRQGFWGRSRGDKRMGAPPEPPYTNALWPVMARPTMSVFISFVPS